MWLLVMLCASVACEADFYAVSAEFTEERCIAKGQAVYAAEDVTWLCIRDLQPVDEWSSFE